MFRVMSTVHDSEHAHFTCPRCHADVAARFYGPCPECRTALRAMYASDGRVIELAEYVPKMNVTPNAVALKDD